MNDLDSMFEQAFTLQQKGDSTTAIAIYRQLLNVVPEAPEVLHFLGLALHQSGNTQAGLKYVQQSLSHLTNHSPYLYNLAHIYSDSKQFPQAIATMNDLIELQPDQAQLWFELGNLHQATENHREAVLCFEKSLDIDPNLTQTYNNLGNSLRLINEFQKAIEVLEKAVNLDPESLEINYNLGLVYTYQNRVDEAIVCFNNSLKVNPENPYALFNLGIQLGLTFQFSEAKKILEKALIIKPDFVAARCTLGVVCRSGGFTDEALKALEEVLENEPSHAGAFWNYQLLLPALYLNESEISYFRERYKKGWQKINASLDLKTEEGKQWALNGIFSFIMFHLQYQGQDDKNLQSQYGKTLCSITQANYPEFCQPLTLTKKSRIRVGFISNRIARYGVGRIILGWIMYLDKNQFEIYFYHMEHEQSDFSRKFEQSASVFRHVPNNWQEIAQCILEDKLDILVFTELSLDIPTMQLAGLRLAPIQCTTWGHTITSGLPTIDYFISNEAMEPINGQRYYTEQLICLPKIGSCFLPPTVPELSRTRSYFGLPEHNLIYLSRQTPLKYLPQFDFIYPAIACQFPLAHFVFVSNIYEEEVGRQLKERLRHAFASYNLVLEDYCTFLPHSSPKDYWNLNLLSEIFLDTFGWSGCLTTLDAIACSLPVVTCPGPTMQSRQSAGILKVMDVTETIATNIEEYIEIAIKLGQDLGLRLEVAQRIYDGQDELFEDQSCVRALETFFQQAILKQSS